MDSIYLHGSEDVSRAAHRMASAAEEMIRAASYIQESFDQHHRFLDDWLSRFEAAVAQTPHGDSNVKQ